MLGAAAVLVSGWVHFSLYFRGGYRGIAPESVIGLTVSRSFALNAVAAVAQCFGEIAEGAVWWFGASQVAEREFVVRIELPGGVVDAVAAFGDGQRDDPGRRGGEDVHHRRRIVGSEQVADQRADHPGLLGSVGGAGRQDIEAVLGVRGVAGGGVRWQQPDAADTPAGFP